MKRWTITGALLGLLAGCVESSGPFSSDGSTRGSTAGGPGGGAGAGPGSGSSVGGAPDQWTDCTSPDGYEICGGTHNCPASCDIMEDEATCLNLNDGGVVALCVNQAWINFDDSDCWLCADGEVCINIDVLPYHAWSCAPMNLAILYAINGGGTPDWLRYADYGLWTDFPLPEPVTCPTFDGFEICGGHCGGCPASQVCTGRSHLHPFGLCVDQEVMQCRVSSTLPQFDCNAGELCFTYTVEPEAQELANENGFCLPANTCQTVAANYPGGGTCAPP